MDENATGKRKNKMHKTQSSTQNVALNWNPASRQPERLQLCAAALIGWDCDVLAAWQPNPKKPDVKPVVHKWVVLHPISTLWSDFQFWKNESNPCWDPDADGLLTCEKAVLGSGFRQSIINTVCNLKSTSEEDWNSASSTAHTTVHHAN